MNQISFHVTKGAFFLRLVLYALGRIFERYRSQIDWKNVIAVSDKEQSGKEARYPVPLVAPNRISSLKYDYVVVFSKMFDDIRMYLVWECNISTSKIISWKGLFPENGDKIRLLKRWLKFAAKEWEQKTVLDSGRSGLEEQCLTKNDIVESKDVRLYTISNRIESFNAAIYDAALTWETLENCYFDYALMGDFREFSVEKIKRLSSKANHLVFVSSHEEELTNVNKGKALSQFGKVATITMLEGIVWIVDTALEEENNVDVSIYVVMHKPYPVKNQRPYIPLCVGAYRASEYLSENCGENISHLNSKLNECTAMYWIWKNTSSKYVGLNHYRRYFYRNGLLTIDNFLEGRDVDSLLKRYDIILPETWVVAKSVSEDMKDSVDRELFAKGYELVRDHLKKYQKSYVEVFDKMMQGHVFYKCNMFIAKRDIFDDYCEWLFSFIIDAAESIDVDGYDSYSKRIIGFFAERMLTVWLWNKSFRSKQLPVVTPHW